MFVARTLLSLITHRLANIYKLAYTRTQYSMNIYNVCGFSLTLSSANVTIYFPLFVILMITSLTIYRFICGKNIPLSLIVTLYVKITKSNHLCHISECPLY